MAARKMKQKIALFGFVGVSGLRDLTTAKARSPMMNNACGLFSSSGVSSSSRLRNLTTAASPVRKILLAVHRTCLLQGFSEKGFDKVDNAFTLFDAMLASEEYHWPEQFNFVLTGVARMNPRHPETIVSLFNRMRSRGIPVVSKYTLTIVVSSFCRMGRLDYAFSVLGSFFKHGFAPEEFTYAFLMNGLIKQDQNAQAVELFDKLMIPKGGWVSPDENMYATAMRAYIKMGGEDNWAAAMQIFRRIPAGSSMVVPYNTIICSLCEEGRVDDAMAVYCNVWKGRAIPDRPVFNCLIKELAYLGRWKDVAKILEEMAWPGMPEYKEDVPWYEEDPWYGEYKEEDVPWYVYKEEEDVPWNEEFKKELEVRDLSTFHVLVEAYWNKPGISWQKLRTMLISTSTEKNFSSFLFAYFLRIDGVSNDRMGNWKEEELLDVLYGMNLKYEGELFKTDMVLKMMRLGGLKPNVVTYNMLIDDYFSQWKFAEAMELLNVMKMSRGVNPDAVSYNILVEGCCRANRVDDGLKLFREMHQKGFKPDAGTYSTLLIGLLLRGRSTEAQDVFHEMVRMGISIIDLSTNPMLLNGLFEGIRIHSLPVNKDDAYVRMGGLLNKWVKQNVCDEYLFDEADQLMLEIESFTGTQRFVEYHQAYLEAGDNLPNKS